MQTSTELTIRNYHIDHFGHVNHARYVEFLEEARWQYLERNQLLEPIHRLEAFHVVSEINIEYRRPAILGEVLRIDTSIDGRWRNGFRVVQNGYVKTSGKDVG